MRGLIPSQSMSKTLNVIFNDLGTCYAHSPFIYCLLFLFAVLFSLLLCCFDFVNEMLCCSAFWLLNVYVAKIQRVLWHCNTWPILCPSSLCLVLTYGRWSLDGKYNLFVRRVFVKPEPMSSLGNPMPILSLLLWCVQAYKTSRNGKGENLNEKTWIKDIYMLL